MKHLVCLFLFGFSACVFAGNTAGTSIDDSCQMGKESSSVCTAEGDAEYEACMMEMGEDTTINMSSDEVQQVCDDLGYEVEKACIKENSTIYHYPHSLLPHCCCYHSIPPL